MSNIMFYEVGTLNTPKWFLEETSKGKILINQDEEGNFISLTINSPSGKKIAYPGNFIAKLNSGIVILTEEQAIRYGVKKNANKQNHKEVKEQAEK